MRKHTKRRVNYGLKPMAPMLISRGIHDKKLETVERMAISMFMLGRATASDFYLLQDMLNLLLIAGQSAPNRKYALDRANHDYKPVLESLKARYDRTGKFGMTGEEHTAMQDMVSFSRTFWLRQPTELLAVCDAQVRAFNREQEAARKAA